MPNKVLQLDGTQIVWQDTDPADGRTFHALTAASLGIGIGRQGAWHDFGVVARPSLFHWAAWMRTNGVPVVGETLRVALLTSNGAHPSVATGDAAITENALRNGVALRSVQVTAAAADTEFSYASSAPIIITARYAKFCFVNKTSSILKATNNVSGAALIPVPAEIQAAA